MKTLAEIRTDKRIEFDPRIPVLFDEKTGKFVINAWARVQKNKSALWASVIASNDENGMEHASVAFKDRCPTWEEMCIVKDIFWREDEACIQLHPMKSEYVNFHETCLHIWRMKDAADGWPFISGKE